MTTNQALETAITVACSVIASSGFWALLQKRFESKNVTTKLLHGLAHDRIIFLGEKYIARGWITNDEYENLVDYLWRPYVEMGGNGSAKRMMEVINTLPFAKTELIGEEPNDDE